MRLLLVVAVVLAVAAGGVAGERLGRTGQGRVDAVLDGDTIVVDGVHVRVIGVDTPEIAHRDAPAACGGDDAAAFVRRAVLGRRVRLAIGVEPRDRYGRTLAGVTVLTGPLAGADLAATLADRGLARPLPIPPNDGNAADIARRVRAARAGGLGLWSACGFDRAFPGR
jgi:endonuclease YncB( thermonuclease family)